MSVLTRWREFQRSQREALRESNLRHPGGVDGENGADGASTTVVPEPLGGLLPDGSVPTAPSSGSAQTEDEQEAREVREAQDAQDAQAKEAQEATDALPYGRAGRPLNRQSPFYLGFVGALGVLAAVLLWQTLGRLTTVLTLIVVSFFLTLALNPLVEFFTRRRLTRPWAVTVVFFGLVGVFTLLGLLVVPPVVTQGSALIKQAPDWVNTVLSSSFVRNLDQHYGVVTKIQGEFNKKLTDSSFISQVFGGVLGVGAAVIGGIFQAFTVLILTLFLLASFPRVKEAAFQIVPASRRVRVVSLSEEIMRRTGSYAIGQVAVATVNAFCSWIMMSIVGIQYAAVLAVAVGFLGLIPMVGATSGATLVCLVAVFDEPRKAVIAAVYYIVYQQVENYVVMPRIMAHTVSVPGAVTVVAALAGGTLLGVLGALLAIPVAAGLLLLYEEVLLPRQRHH
ncbi:putative PurR-regulated permease PerM [Phycicoccus badiiscoriae]|uniref:Putative PurR-regulated permease PerM n=1 Tax=Pedococcus badiiscoriae TaxID=642776 RepID=A0A852WKK1_9MICO|nr:AI-2E family transporter [Pedococcus badiiscoriae]NYG06016.1 putative PurR-regulated permease PerM [Pedococcus badiiscoriae]